MNKGFMFTVQVAEIIFGALGEQQGGIQPYNGI